MGKERQQIKNRKKPEIGLKKAAIFVFWLCVWQALSLLAANNILLVGPLETAKTFWQLLQEPAFFSSIGNSLCHILTGFFLAAGSGICLGWISYHVPFCRALLSPLVSLMKAIPVASFVILALIWLGGSRNLSTFVSFVVVFPMIYLSTLSGLFSTDPKLLEFAFVFRLNWFRRLRYIEFPALLPYLLSCFQTALGMCWKSGVAAELIGQPQHTIGANLYQAKIFLDTPSLFAWTASLIFISWCFEKILLLALKRFSVLEREEEQNA